MSFILQPWQFFLLFRFRADPLQSYDPGKEFRIDAVRSIGWRNSGRATVERPGGFWYLKPVAAVLPDELRWLTR